VQRVDIILPESKAEEKWVEKRGERVMSIGKVLVTCGDTPVLFIAEN